MIKIFNQIICIDISNQKSKIYCIFNSIFYLVRFTNIQKTHKQTKIKFNQNISKKTHKQLYILYNDNKIHKYISKN